MNNADLIVLFAVLLCLSVNRQSLIFLCAFSASEVVYHLSYTDFSFSVITACIYSFSVFKADNIKYQLQFALSLYAILFWFNAFDYWLTEQQTYFYVIFPYVTKLIDIYVIFQLIHKGQGSDRFNSTNHCSFN